MNASDPFLESQFVRPLRIVEETPQSLPEYEKISIAFRVESRFRVELREGGLGEIRLIEEPVTPYIKDYDGEEKYRPSRWHRHWDLSSWGILGAHIGDRRVGGAAIAWKTPGLDMLGDSIDQACLWDLRVHPDDRGRGIGRELFARAAAWSQARSCRTLVVETQNINVPACGFYARQGCELVEINRHAYEPSLNETQLIWRRDL